MSKKSRRASSSMGGAPSRAARGLQIPVPKASKRGAQHRLERRRLAVEALKAEYAGKAFALGSADCAQMVRSHLARLGHEVPEIAAYRRAADARAALKALGVTSVGEWLDRHLERIAPAAALAGDIIELKSEPGTIMAELGAMTVSLGRKVMGWSAAVPGLVVMAPQPDQIAAAWRVVT